MGATQIVLIVMILILVVVYPILVSTRNKKENQKITEQTNSLKRGDKVLTTAGVYGTIVDLQMENDKKIVTIETGSGKNKGYISVDAYAIYTVFKSEEEKAAEKAALEAKKAEEKTIAEEKKLETSEVKTEEIQTDELLKTGSSASEIEAEVSGKKPKARKKKED